MGLNEMIEVLYEHPELVVKAYFKDRDGNPLILTEYQIEFIKAGLSRKHPRMCIIACTQSGKSTSIAVLLSLYAIFFPNERIVNISHTDAQARIIFEEVKRHLVEDSNTIREMVDLNRSLGSTKEFSKTRMFMKSGTDIRVLSVGIGETDNTGATLFGFEGTIVNIDESSNIPDSVFYSKILRMLGAKRTTGFDKQLILVGTPQKAGGFFEEAFNDPNYYKIQIGWERAVKAGRMDIRTIDEQRQKMPRDMFIGLYEARFPPMGEDSMYDRDEVKQAIAPKDSKFYGNKILSVDVARFGRDSTIYSLVDKLGDTYRVVDVFSDFHKDLMSVTGRIVSLNKEYKFDYIVVDSSGIGGGVFDRLNEQGLNVIQMIGGAKCTNKDAEKTCLNLKAELHAKCKRLFEQGKLKILDVGATVNEFRQIKKDYTSNGQLKIIDPDKSPDYVDSLVYSLYEPNLGTFVIVDFAFGKKKVGFSKEAQIKLG